MKKEKTNLKEEMTTASIATTDGGLPSAQKVYDFYLDNVKKRKDGNFTIKNDDKFFSDKDINKLYESFQKHVFSKVKKTNG